MVAHCCAVRCVTDDAATVVQVCEHFPAAAEAESAEWWVHTRQQDAAHQMHFDLDESRLSVGDGVHAPIVSSVLYLECGGGAPTLVCNQRVGSAPATAGWLAEPASNRLTSVIRLTNCPSRRWLGARQANVSGFGCERGMWTATASMI